MPRRKPGALLPIEVDILEVGLSCKREGTEEFHGFELAHRIAGGRVGRKLTSHGTLYKALGRLEDAGLLVSRWEEAAVAHGEGRPRRRLYTVTGVGAHRLAVWREEQGSDPVAWRPRWEGA